MELVQSSLLENFFWLLQLVEYRAWKSWGRKMAAGQRIKDQTIMVGLKLTPKVNISTWVSYPDCLLETSRAQDGAELGRTRKNDTNHPDSYKASAS